MLKLTERDYDFYTWNGVRFELNLSFDNVLLLFDLFVDKSIPIRLQLDIALNMLVVDKVVLSQLDEDVQFQLVVDILKDKLDIDLLADKKEEKEPKIPVYDFTVDSERIFSSFLFDYKINLFEQQGKMKWNEFIALFRNLSDKSPMGIAIHYRTCEVPKKDKHNDDERKHIKKMKEKYELPAARAIREKHEFEAFQKNMEAQKARLKAGEISG
ncbi:Gp15 family bacteriophage protein [Bacillus sp. BP-3]|uniref:Gp15 family bacteriophage protein n=1 Tax=Bacillus sp. BP-3 TaxID=3022773 RepID=UPI00232E8B35|nr:Gp15 family bacteriophage protein [Bacillus sp. BP-3]MDC2867560.1 Gp15 family bacteriophage protein [Bacillus sp. BP-3]